jgi:phosphatidylinositol dimannoside acyltransferase
MPLYLAVTAGSVVVTVLSRRVAYALGSAAGSLAYLFSSRARHAIQGNLAVVFDRPADSPVVRRTARAAFRNNGRNWTDALRLGSTTKAEIERRVKIDGWDLLEAASTQGKGVILVGAHLGNIDVVGQIVAARGHQVTVPVEPVHPAALFRRTQRLRQSLGIHTVDTTTGARELLRALAGNQVVGIMADRNLAQTGVEVEFFGRPAIVSRGPAWLISKSEAPVLVGSGIRRPDGTFVGSVSALNVRRTGDPAADERANAQSIISAVEERIREHPEQWSMFVSVWKR